jgi:hypothetical protein
MVRRSGERQYGSSGVVDTLPLTIGSELMVVIGPDMVRVRIDRTASGADEPVLYPSEL